MRSLKVLSMMLPLISLALPLPLAHGDEEGGFGSYLSAQEKGADAPAPDAPQKKKKKKKRKSDETHRGRGPDAAPNEMKPTQAAFPKELAPPAQPKAAPPTTAEPAAPAPAASPFKFGGFADVRYTRFSTHNDPNVPNANAESGFGLEDSAFYATYEKDRVSAVLDLAMRRSKDADTNPGATTPNQSSNNNFGVAVDKSQLYLKYKLTPDLVADLGQFDTIFGVELNDSKDRVFGKTGLVYDYALPVTHTGAMLEYATHGAYAKAFGANPNNKGSSGSSINGDDHTEMGGALGYANEVLRAQAGYMGRGINRPAGLGRGTRSLVDATAGTTLGAFSLDLEYSRIADASKNTLTPNDNTDMEAPGQAYLALASYKVSADWQVGVRYEELHDDPSGVGIKTGKSKGLSVHYKLTPELELRSEAIDYKFTNPSNTPWNDSRVSVGAVLTF